MKDWIKTLIRPSDSIVKAIQIIEASALQIALVVDVENKLMGTVTDGDIRRGILNGLSLDKPVQLIMNTNPIIAGPGESRESIFNRMALNVIHHVPVVDEKGCLVALETVDDVIRARDLDNWVVLMAGGLGSRLRPLTEDCPKPLLKVGGKPLLEIIIENFRDSGFRKFYVSVNYKAEMIMDYCGDGSQWGVEIGYIHERIMMGTAGSLGLIPEKPAKPIFVMNSDVLTKVNFRQMLNFHMERKAQATMCVKEYKLQVPYGVVKIEGDRLAGIEEKPVHCFFINSGIYILNPEVLEFIPYNTYYDMSALFKQAVERQIETTVFPIREYWLDIGRRGDYERANGEYGSYFK